MDITRMAIERQARIDVARAVGSLAAELAVLIFEGCEDVARERAEARVRVNPDLADVAEAMLTVGPWEAAAAYEVSPIGDLEEVITQGVRWDVEGITLDRPLALV